MGFSVHKFDPYLNGFYIRKHLIYHLNIKNVIDVGANEGQYAEGLFKEGYKNNLYSFEPTNSTFKILNNKAQNRPNWRVYNYGLSNTSGNQEMYSVDFSPECSLLKRKDEYFDSKKEMITLITFDEWINKENINLNNFWFKIDVEGYEKFVLEGSKENLHKAAIVELEVSALRKFHYDDLSNESSLTNLTDYMKQCNFTALHITNLYQERTKLLFSGVDIIFIRNDLKDQLKDLF